jgi:glucose-6-phosphate isomerase
MFTNCKAFHKLSKLAQNPFDLSQEGQLTPARLSKLVAESAGYRLLYGTERVTEEVMQVLHELAQEMQAHEKMQRMQAGDVMNFIQAYPRENRPALHTAVRDFFDDPQTAQAAAEATAKAKNEVDKLREFIDRIDAENRFNHLVCVAIGGSDLGPRAHHIALKHLQKKDRSVCFVSNVDPDDAAMALKHLDLNRTLVSVVSKSGTTLETATNEEFFRARFVSAGLDPKEHFIAITSEGSPMDQRCKDLECFYMWDWIGGRFSTSSMVGGVMLAFAFGFDVYREFLKGAHAMDRAALNRDLHKNLPLLGALLEIWNHNFLHHETLALIPYSQGLARYPAHIQQVEMESNGKHITQQGQEVLFQTGPILWGEPGTNAQHSFYQLLHQGTAIAAMELVGFRQSRLNEDVDFEGTTSQQKFLSNLFAQSIALATGEKNANPNKVFKGNRPSHLLLAKQLTPYSLGGLLAYFEHKVAFEGFIWGINSFDQEGVQLGKILAKKIINVFKGQDKYPLGEAYLQQLKLL